jgi:hypothetical protein
VSAPPPKAESITLAIDGGHVTAVRSYQARSCAVFVAQFSNDNGKHVVFSSMPAETDRRRSSCATCCMTLGRRRRRP